MRINYITFDPWWDTDTTMFPPLAEKFDVHVFCLNQFYGSCKYPKKTVPANTTLYQINQKYRNNDPRSIWYALKLLYKSYLTCRKEECIYFITPVTNIWFALLVLLIFPKSRTVLSSHNYVEHGDKNGTSATLQEGNKRRAYRKFHFFHFYSKNQMNLFKKDYPNKVAFYTAMPPKDYGSMEPRNRKDSKINLLFFGSIRDYKRLDWLIIAVNQLKASNLRVIIAGKASSKDEKKYMEMIDENECFETHFGFIANDDIPKYFAEADFLVLPYRSATQSGPSLIAINYGVPVVAPDVPTFKELIKDGKNGYMFNHESLDSLIDVIKNVSEMSFSDINKMKEEQKRFKERYIKDNNVEERFIGFIKDKMMMSP